MKLIDTPYVIRVDQDDVNLPNRIEDQLKFLQDNPDRWLGYGNSGNLDETTIERLIKERNEARGNKNFDLADKIRNELKEKGIEIEDTKNGTIWKSA